MFFYSTIQLNKETGKREVIINPTNSTKALQSIILHETIHDMENTNAYKKLSNTILSYAKTKEDYKEAYQDFTNMYKEEYSTLNEEEFTNAINQELVADIISEKLGNQEFIDHLVSTDKPSANILQRMAISISNYFNKLTGYKNEKLYWQDVVNKFEVAYNKDFNNNDTNNIKNSITKGDIIDKFDDVGYNEDGTPVRQGNLINEYRKALTPEQWKKYAEIMRMVDMRNDHVRIDLISGKNILTEIKNKKEQVRDVFKVKKSSNQYIKFVIDEVNKNGYYSRREVQEYVKMVYGNENIIRYNPATNKFDNNQEWEQNRERINREHTENEKRITDKIKNTRNNQEGNVKSRGLEKSSPSSLNGTNKKYSLATIRAVDNEGRTLTKEQQEYFKDSKVRDKNGNLMVMYHGTPNAGFTEFYKDSYFSSNKDYADNYQDETASLLKTNKIATNKNTYKVYLNIKNPFTVDNSESKRIYIEEYIKGGNSEFYDPYTSIKDYYKQFENFGIDWLEAENLAEWIRENHPEYDGLIVEGVPVNSNDDSPNLEYITFNANQIKNVDNENPTSSDDIRYSKSSNGDYQKFLKDNFSNNGTKTYMRDIKKAPTSEDLKNKNSAPVQEVINKFNGYTNKEIQNISSDKISIATSRKSISDFVRSLKNKLSNKKNVRW